MATAHAVARCTTGLAPRCVFAVSAVPCTWYHRHKALLRSTGCTIDDYQASTAKLIHWAVVKVQDLTLMRGLHGCTARSLAQVCTTVVPPKSAVKGSQQLARSQLAMSRCLYSAANECERGCRLRHCDSKTPYFYTLHQGLLRR